jgi:hypothetical protein
MAGRTRALWLLLQVSAAGCRRAHGAEILLRRGDETHGNCTRAGAGS